jgi:hypothetical protein
MLTIPDTPPISLSEGFTVFALILILKHTEIGLITTLGDVMVFQSL